MVVFFEILISKSSLIWNGWTYYSIGAGIWLKGISLAHYLDLRFIIGILNIVVVFLNLIDVELIILNCFLDFINSTSFKYLILKTKFINGGSKINFNIKYESILI